MKRRNIKNSVIGTFLIIGLILSQSVFAQSAVTINFFGEAYSPTGRVPKRIFVEALAEAFTIPPSTTTRCYKDTTRKTTTNAIICGLAEKRILTASKNRNFLPEAKVTWNFAIQTLCRTQRWTAQKTFSKCLEYARNKGFLDKPLPSRVRSTSQISYKNLAYLFERALQNPPSKEASQAPPPPQKASQPISQGNLIVPTRTISQKSFSPVQGTVVDTGFFSKIRLAKSFSTLFHLDEVYMIEGELVNSSAEEVLVFLCKENVPCKNNSVNFVGDVTSGHFKIPVFFQELGNFRLGILPGTSGESNVAFISVLAEEPLTQGGATAPTNLSTKYKNGETTFNWSGEGNHLIIFQSNLRKDYFLHDAATSFTPPSKDFASFKKGRAGWLVLKDTTPSIIQEISLVTQEFRKIDTDGVQVKSLTETFSRPENLVFTGQSRATISKKAAFTLPNGEVQDIAFAENDLSANQDFTIQTNLSTTGTYIFEVNSPDGAAVINIPIYVGNITPLLPDIFTTSQAKLDTTPIANLTDERQKLLSLINSDRAANGAGPLQLWDSLNSVAQAHSQNMVALNFFGHTDPAGKTPEDRRKQAGISAPIKENLGKATSLELVEAGLMRSPIHRSALIDPNMKRVGLGMAKNAEGYLLVTQNFTPEPLSQGSLSSIENDFLTVVNAQRATQGFSALSHDPLLRDISADWSQNMAQNNFFSVTSPNGGSLVQNVRGRGVASSVQINIIQGLDVGKIQEELLKEAGLKDPSNRKIGIGVGLSTLGDIFVTIIYTP